MHTGKCLDLSNCFKNWIFHSWIYVVDKWNARSQSEWFTVSVKKLGEYTTPMVQINRGI